jgi:hypothetical protein
MSSPKDIWQLFATDFTDGNWDTAGVHVPPEVALAIVNAVDRDEKARLYNECIDAGLTARDENDQLKEWDKEASNKRHKKDGAKVSENILEKHRRWQDEADESWSHRPALAKNAVAQIIAEHEDNHWTTIRKYINKK